jgi:hypothetical protein
MPTPDSRRPGIEDATTIRGSNQITNDEAVDEVNSSDLKVRRASIFNQSL